MGVAPAWAGAGVLVAVALGIRSGVAPLLGVLDGSGVGVELDIAVGVAVGVAVAVGIAESFRLSGPLEPYPSY